MNKFQKEILNLFYKEGLEDIIIEIPPDSKFGDYAVPCFTFAKKLKKAPNIIAEELSKKLFSINFENILPTGPYINFFVRKELFANILNEIEKDYGKGNKKKENVMVEYCQVNTHKAFHVGHLRGTLLGASIINILRFSGYKVISANYQGDVGAHVAKSLWYLKKHFKGKYPKHDKGIWLGSIYQKANAKFSKDEKYKTEVSKTQVKLENGDKKLNGLWTITRQWSLDDFEQIYNMLNVSFDKYFFESEMEKPGKDIVKELIKKKIASKSDGAIIIDLEKYGLGIFLILKSDKTALYSTKDLALAKLKFEKYKINRSIYIVGSEQAFYFKQLFKTLELMRFKDAKKCIHIPYGLVMLKGGKISSREGELILGSSLINQAIDYAKGEVKKRHKEWNTKQVADSAKNIALGAVKFSMINQDSNKPIIFDMKKALDFEGETGPYIQYAHARIYSILNKNKCKLLGNIKINMKLYDEFEHEIIKMLEMFPKIIEESAENYKPQIIVRYLLDIAKLFNEYYHSHQILKEIKEIRNARLFLIDKVRIVIKNGLNLLGIDAPDKM